MIKTINDSFCNHDEETNVNRTTYGERHEVIYFICKWKIVDHIKYI